MAWPPADRAEPDDLTPHRSHHAADVTVSDSAGRLQLWQPEDHVGDQHRHRGVVHAAPATLYPTRWQARRRCCCIRDSQRPNRRILTPKSRLLSVLAYDGPPICWPGSARFNEHARSDAGACARAAGVSHVRPMVVGGRDELRGGRGHYRHNVPWKRPSALALRCWRDQPDCASSDLVAHGCPALVVGRGSVKAAGVEASAVGILQSQDSSSRTWPTFGPARSSLGKKCRKGARKPKS
jgi:hypothetical protein